jgi:membrane protein
MVVRLDRQIAGRLPSQPRIANPRLRQPRVGYPGVGAVRRRGQDAVALPRWMYRGYTASNAGDLAAAVAFNALIALVPTVLLLFSIAGLILRDDSVLIEAVHASVWAFTPEKAHEAIAAILEARRNTGLYGAISLIGFAWIGSNFVSCLARSMNRVYGVRNRRFVHQRLRDFVVIMLFAVFFLLAAVAAIIPTFFVYQDVNEFFERTKLASGGYQILSYGVSLASAVALFFVLYRIVPNAGQRLRDVWPGTLTAAVLFVAMAQVFPIYFRVFGSIERYGSAFGFVSLLVAWFYLLAHVVLFGTYVNATYQARCRSGAGLGGRSLPGCPRRPVEAVGGRR